MPRKPRQFIAGGIYHVFNRGNNRQRLFEAKGDFFHFLNLMRRAKTRYPVCIFHYCLMNNHFHLLVQCEEDDALPKYMHWLQIGYARYFHKINGTTGHVFEERFRCLRIAVESYYLQCGRYIERNPVKACIVKTAETYPYSSAAYYVLNKSNDLITPNIYYLGLGKNAEDRKKSYRKFLSLEDPYSFMIEDRLLKL